MPNPRRPPKRRPKPRNPNDATFRNIRALKDDVSRLQSRVEDVEARLRDAGL